MGVMKQLAIEEEEERDDLFEYEMHIEACADEMGVSRDEYIDHTQRDFYATLPYPYHRPYSLIAHEDFNDELTTRR